MGDFDRLKKLGKSLDYIEGYIDGKSEELDKRKTELMQDINKLEKKIKGVK